MRCEVSDELCPRSKVFRIQHPQRLNGECSCLYCDRVCLSQFQLQGRQIRHAASFSDYNRRQHNSYDLAKVNRISCCRVPVIAPKLVSIEMPEAREMVHETW